MTFLDRNNERSTWAGFRISSAQGLDYWKPREKIIATQLIAINRHRIAHPGSSWVTRDRMNQWRRRSVLRQIDHLDSFARPMSVIELP